MAAGQDRTRVCIVDDHEVVRDGIKWLLEAADAFEVVGEADNARDGLAIVTAQAPDVAVIDTRLRRRDGRAAIACDECPCPTGQASVMLHIRPEGYGDRAHSAPRVAGLARRALPALDCHAGIS